MPTAFPISNFNLILRPWGSNALMPFETLLAPYRGLLVMLRSIMMVVQPQTHCSNMMRKVSTRSKGILLPANFTHGQCVRSLVHPSTGRASSPTEYECLAQYTTFLDGLLSEILKCQIRFFSSRTPPSIFLEKRYCWHHSIPCDSS